MTVHAVHFYKIFQYAEVPVFIASCIALVVFDEINYTIDEKCLNVWIGSTPSDWDGGQAVNDTILPKVCTSDQCAASARMLGRCVPQNMTWMKNSNSPLYP